MSQYEDKQLTCVENGCGEFTFTAGEQGFYADKEFSAPKRCPRHREEARKRRESNGVSTSPRRESDADMLR